MAYVEVTLDDMDRFLKRGYRALRPKQGTARGEIYYDLDVSDRKIFIRVWTSIHPRSGTGAGVGEDAIRVAFVTAGNSGLIKGSKTVKRTGRWKSTLQEKIEELLEMYESQADYWKDRRRKIDGDGDEAPAAEARPPTATGDAFEGGFARLKSRQGWGIQIWVQGKEGDEGFATTQGKKRSRVRLLQLDWKGENTYNPERVKKYTEIWTFEEVNGKGGTDRFAEDNFLAGRDPLVESVASRYLRQLV